MSTPRGRTPALTAGLAVVVLVPVVLWASWTDILFFLDFETLGPNAQLGKWRLATEGYGSQRGM